MDHRKSVGEEPRALDDLHASAVSIGELARGSLEFGGAKIVRRRVDKIAAEIERLGKRQHLFFARALGEDETLLLGVVRGLVAREAVAPRKEAERRKFGVGKGRGEAIVTLRQRGGEHARKQRRKRGPVLAASAKEDAANAARTSRQEQNRTLLGLPALCLDPATLGPTQILEHGIVLGGDEANGEAFG